MAVYFELFIACELAGNTPEAVINTIRCLLGETPEPDIHHNCYGTDVSFQGKYGLLDQAWKDKSSSLNFYKSEYYEHGGVYSLKLWISEIPHWDMGEIEQFLCWLAQYSISSFPMPSNFVGFIKSERLFSNQPDPISLIYFEDGKAYWVQPDMKQKILIEPA